MEGLKALTRNPAEVLGIGGRKGEIKEGKDADLVIWSGRPFDSCTKAETVFIMGKKGSGKLNCFFDRDVSTASCALDTLFGVQRLLLVKKYDSETRKRKTTS